MRSTDVSVPGKLILMGEHAVVYGRPALVAAVGVRLRVTVRDADGDGVHLTLPQIGVEETTSWVDLLAYAREVRRRWEAFAAHPSRSAFLRLRGADPAHVVKVALGEAARDHGASGEPGVSLRLDSEIPIGSGFGSSAAAAVGVIAAYREHRGCEWGPGEVARIAMEVERRQHGLPSGVDHTTVVGGGVLWARKGADGAVRAEQLSLPDGPVSRILVFDSGRPSESTGDVVAAVRQRLEESTDRGREILDRMEKATRTFRGLLSRQAEDATAMVEAMRGYERCLEALGVVPDAVQKIIRGIEADGGAAKVSGAGALSGTGAGGVLVYHPSPARLKARTAGLRPHRVRLGAPGLRREVAA